MERLVTSERLTLSDDARLGGTQSPNLKAKLDRLENYQLYFKVGSSSQAG